MAAFAGTTTEITRFEQLLDRAADEVFSTMMGTHCLPAAVAVSAEHETVSAVIGLAGALSGTLVLQSSNPAAMHMAERMTGMPPEGVDAIVRDAIGEVCNMVAGAWKGFDPALSSGCLLSTPTVVTGQNYELYSQRSSIRILRHYRFDDFCFTVKIHCELS